MNHSFLSRDDERELVIRCQSGDTAASHELVLRHRPLVLSIAKRYQHWHILEDLVQEGFLGLLEAAKRFDPSKGVRFSTYAPWWVRYFIQSEIGRLRIVRFTTRRHRQARNRLQTVTRELEQRLGRSATAEELGQAIGVSTDTVLEVLLLMTVPPAEIATVGSDAESGRKPHVVELPAAGALPDELVDDEQQKRRVRTAVDSLLRQLDDRERAIVQQRILTDEQEPLRSIGARWGLSGERVRQLEKSALQKMRIIAASRGINAESLLR